jgi:hypothetical protein
MTYLVIVFAAVLAILPLFRLLTVISKRRNRLTAAEVADRIERHIQGTEGPWDWDRFTSVPISDDRLDAIRLQCVELQERTEELKMIVERLRN